MLRVTLVTLIVVSAVLAVRHPFGDVPERTDENGQKWVGPIRVCPLRTTDQEINDCVVKMLEDLKPRIGKGMPEIGFKGIDPFVMNKFDYQQKFGPVRVNVALKDIRLEGFSQYKNLQLIFDTKNRNLTFVYEVPEVQLSGIYKAGGSAVVFPITGSGPAAVQISNIRASGQMTYTVTTREDGKDITQIKDIDMNELKIGGMHVRIRGLFSGNPLMSTVVHYFANNYGPQLFDGLLKEQLSKGIAEIIKQDLVNPFLYNMPHFAPYIQK